MEILFPRERKKYDLSEKAGGFIRLYPPRSRGTYDERESQQGQL
jgi:hypothetical protein